MHRCSLIIFTWCLHCKPAAWLSLPGAGSFQKERPSTSASSLNTFIGAENVNDYLYVRLQIHTKLISSLKSLIKAKDGRKSAKAFVLTICDLAASRFSVLSTWSYFICYLNHNAEVGDHEHISAQLTFLTLNGQMCTYYEIHPPPSSWCSGVTLTPNCVTTSWTEYQIVLNNKIMDFYSFEYATIFFYISKNFSSVTKSYSQNFKQTKHWIFLQFEDTESFLYLLELFPQWLTEPYSKYHIQSIR